MSAAGDIWDYQVSKLASATSFPNTLIELYHFFSCTFNFSWLFQIGQNKVENFPYLLHLLCTDYRVQCETMDQLIWWGLNPGSYFFQTFVSTEFSICKTTEQLIWLFSNFCMHRVQYMWDNRAVDLTFSNFLCVQSSVYVRLPSVQPQPQPVSLSLMWSVPVGHKTLIHTRLKEKLDLATAWSQGHGIITSAPTCMRAVCFLCGSAGKEKVMTIIF